MSSAPSIVESIRDGALLMFGDQVFTFGKEAVELRDSRALVGEREAMHTRLAEDGYLFIRGFHPRPLAEAAAQVVFRAIQQREGLAPGTPVEEGVASEENKNFGFFRDIDIAHSREVLDVVDGPHTFAFFERLLGGPVITFDKRWLRAMARGGSNYFHYDSAYVGRGTRNRYTMWSALTDIDLENGPLVLCAGSHRHQRLIETYGQIDMDRDLIDPVFSKDPAEMVERFGFQLATAHFQPGDVAIFGLHTMHSSIPNRTNQYRISIDTRYQLAADEPDDRFFGPGGTWKGNFYTRGAVYTPME